jgi:hypothetical protein
MGVTPTWTTSCRSRTAEKIRTQTCKSYARPAMGAKRETSNDGKGSRKRALAWWLCNHRCSVKRNASVACVRLSWPDAAAQRRHSAANADQKLARAAYIKSIASSAAELLGREFRRTFVRRHAITRGKGVTRRRSHASNAESNSSAKLLMPEMGDRTAASRAGGLRGAKTTCASALSARSVSVDAAITRIRT